MLAWSTSKTQPKLDASVSKGLFKAIVHTDWRRIAEGLSEVSLHPILWLKIKLLE